ncbi:MAG: hypothetical protein COT33_02515 [Candidatus Nealsonbacteria bacterium CG08_land_8_20_14_0_20_38_20]|uniref:Histidine kinase/HSP90-like ATPase domain-containing protein n=1 Tax=Candidatus Nealsonbacteria bacterium CG08_land_8_20_14_0_20_38_20 TaxID=1974705 RepID=A0A2H0YLQ6_9BACT|nr:MAG: hypothetical protein COT33_02515 [Candidatus Nealsonbacteria bacterium CG08_land_8_20_14_0_20_38_20]
MIMLNYIKNFSVNKLDDEFEPLSQEIEKQNLPNGFRQFALYAIAELFNNIKEHSDASEVSISAAIKDNNFSLIISDNGIGVRESYLRKGIYPKDDFSATQFALSGLSTKESRERGFGLYTIRKFVQGLEGVMVLGSGQASVRIIKNQIELTDISFQKGVKLIIETPIKEVDFYKNIE